MGNYLNNYPPPNKSEQIKTPNEQDTKDASLEKHPIFMFDYIDKKWCICKCEKPDKKAFSKTLNRLSQLTWKEIINSYKHSNGYEKIPIKQIKASKPKNIITPDVHNVEVFRFKGKKAMAGVKRGVYFYIIWIDSNYTLYDHN